MRWPLMLCATALAVILAGCGSGGEMSATPSPPDREIPAPTNEIGPFVIHTAATPDLQIESFPGSYRATMVAIHGATLDYIAVQEMLDHIVYRSQLAGQHALWVRDLFGANPHRISTYNDYCPTWSPDGTMIACQKNLGSDAEIILMDADGNNRRRLTNNGEADWRPAFSRDGYLLVFGRSHNLYTMNLDGSEQTCIRANTVCNPEPAWAPSTRIHYVQDGVIVSTPEDGSIINDLSSPGPNADGHPTVAPTSGGIAFHRTTPGGTDIYTMDSNGSSPRKFIYGPDWEGQPYYSTDGRFIAFSRYGESYDIWLKEVDPPYREYQITDSSSEETGPALGNPTLQTSRVLVGPEGSDRGFDPMGGYSYQYAYAAVLSFDQGEYLSFLRIGVRPGDVASMVLTPLADPGSNALALEVTAPSIPNLLQDAGPGEEPDVWAFSPEPTAAVIIFDTNTGRVLTVLTMWDEVYPSTDSSRTNATVHGEGDRTIVRGAFSAVFGPRGELLAPGPVGGVEVIADGGDVRVF